MKKFLLFAVVAILFAACTQDVAVEILSPNIADDAPDTLTVGFEGDDTRIQLNENVKTVWTNGDQVSVFYRSDANQKWEYTGETGARIADLTRVDEGVATEDMKRVVVVYPYNENYYINTDTFNVQATLPAVQTYLEDSYGLNGNIMISQGEYNDISLKSVCGWLKLQLTGNGEKIKSITLKGNNGEQVAGELYINSADATAILSSDAGSADDGEIGGVGGDLVFEDTILKEVTLDCDEGVELGAEATAFYIALPPQTFENGLTLDIRDIDGYLMTQTTTNSVVIARNTIQPMSEFKFEGTFPNNEIFYIATNKVEPYSGDWGANIVSNVWNEHTGEGVISFDGEVLQIPDRAFGYGITNAWLKSITIPSSVKVLGDEAFGGMSITQGVFENIVFAKGSQLEKVGAKAFKLNPSLKNIYLPNTVKEIGQGICFGCGALEGVYLNNDYYDNWYFGRAAVLCNYDGNNKYNIVVFPAVFSNNNQPSNVLAGATNIEYGAISMSNVGSNLHWWWFENIDSYNFANCDALSWVTLDRVQTIGDYVLYMCDALLSIDLPMASVIGSNCFTDNSVLKSISLGCDELEIISSMGSNCPMLTTLRIPAGVASITSSFNSCGALEEIFVKALVPPVLTDSFDSVVAPTIYVPADSVNVYKSAEGWKEFAIVGYDFETGEVVPGQPNTEIWYTATETVEPYDTSVFGANIISNEWNAETGEGVMAFDGEVTMIGENAFYGCSSLTSVNIPDSVITIGEHAFRETYLKNITLGNSVQRIEHAAFMKCSFTSITFPESLTHIAHDMCFDCSSLETVYFKSATPPSIIKYNSFGEPFRWCDNLVAIYVPSSGYSAYRSTFPYELYYKFETY